MMETDTDAPQDITREALSIVACLTDLTTSTKETPFAMSERGWEGLCLILLMVETRLTRLSGMIE